MTEEEERLDAIKRYSIPQEYWDVMAEPLYDHDKKSFLRRLFGL